MTTRNEAIKFSNALGATPGRVSGQRDWLDTYPRRSYMRYWVKTSLRGISENNKSSSLRIIRYFRENGWNMVSSEINPDDDWVMVYRRNGPVQYDAFVFIPNLDCYDLSSYYLDNDPELFVSVEFYRTDKAR